MKQKLSLLIVITSMLGVLRADNVAQTQTAPQTQRSAKTIEGVVFEPTAHLLFLTPEQQRVAYRNLRQLVPHNVISHGSAVSKLPSATVDLSGFSYEYQNRKRSLDDFLNETRVAGILVIKDGHVVLEKYSNGHNADSVWVSFSVAKSVLSLLFGAALQDGSIATLDDTVTKYLPSMRGSAYDAVTLRQLLQMSSGVSWNEDETDPNSDLVRSSRIGRTGGIQGLLNYMKGLPRSAPAGTVFNYNTGETNIAGAVLRAATGRTLAEYLSEKIWKPAGMEADAFWLLMQEGDSEYGGCCISATLRDYGRLGLLALRKGTTSDRTRLLPERWIADSTTPATTAPIYGYYWWLEGEERFAASGSFGQYIYIDPANKAVVAIHSLWPVAWNKELPAHRRAFLRSLTPALSQRDAK